VNIMLNVFFINVYKRFFLNFLITFFNVFLNLQVDVFLHLWCGLFIAQRPTLSLDRKDSISRPESTASTTVSTPSLQSPSSPTAAVDLSSHPCCSAFDASDGRGSRTSSDDTGFVAQLRRVAL